MTERIRVAELEPGTARVKPSQMQPVTGWDVEAFRLAGDDDSAAIRRGMVAVSGLGGGTLLLSRPVYYLKTPVEIDGLVDVTIQGGVNLTKIRVAPGTGVVSNAFEAIDTVGSGGVAFKRVRLVGLDFSAPLDPASVRDASGNQVRARDERTWTSPDRFGQAVRVVGSYRGPAVYNPKHEDLEIADCVFFGLSGLPVFVDGVAGRFSFLRPQVERCKDPGARWCEEAISDGLASRWSADNGISWSRGNKRAIVKNGTVDDAWFSGVMVGQFDGDPGPDDITVTGMIIRNVGLNGIMADGGGVQYIVGNTVHKATRGAQNNVNTAGIGIRTGGIDGHVASGLIAMNELVDCERGGVGIGSYFDVIRTAGNRIVRPGMPTFTEGGIVSDGGSYNFGEAVMASSDPLTTGRYECAALSVYDTRTQTSGGSTFAVARYDSFVGSASSSDVQGIVASGVRYPTDPAFTRRLTVTSLTVGGPTAETEGRVTVDASSSSRLRGFFVKAAGLNRFGLQANGASAFDFNSSNDDGSSRATDARWSRTTGIWTFFSQLLATAGAKVTGGALNVGDSAQAADARVNFDKSSSTYASGFTFRVGGALRHAWQSLTATTLDFVVYADDGTTPTTVATISRGTTKRWIFPVPVGVATYATGTRPSASSAGAGGMIWDSDLKKLLVSSGSSWYDQTGTTV